MVLTLYKLDGSPPSRAAHMLVDLLGLEVKLIDVNLMEGAHFKKEFLEINPQHTIPTLIDDDFCIWDSHAIAAYLVGKYADNDSLYPKDLKKRAVVDQRLHFDSGILFPATRGTAEPIIFHGQTYIPDERIAIIKKAYDLLETLLANTSGEWIAGDQLTIADICCIADVTSLDAITPIDETKYPKITAWVKKCGELPICQNINAPGTEQFRTLVHQNLK